MPSGSSANRPHFLIVINVDDRVDRCTGPGAGEIAGTGSRALLHQPA
jgi:hypothetical protein